MRGSLTRRKEERDNPYRVASAASTRKGCARAARGSPANMSETVTTGKFSVEGESGSEADEHGGAARAVRRGSRGSGRSLRRGSPLEEVVDERGEDRVE